MQPNIEPRYLRISTTPACAYRCPYCQPEGPSRSASSGSSSPQRIAAAVRVLARLGVGRVRLTGGEPLLRRDCADIVRALVDVPGISEVTLTTNGERLAQRAEQLRGAGLRRVNIHLDTLRAERFQRLTGQATHARVLEGIVAAQNVGLSPIKINVVLMKGINDDEILDFCAWGAEQDVVVRFIELMNTGPARDFVHSHFLSGKDARNIIRGRHRLEPRFESRGCSPAQEYVLDEGAATVGFIEAESKPFCAGCNRLRLTHDGRLSTCLYGGAPLHLARLLDRVDSDSPQATSAVRLFLEQKRSRNPSVVGQGHDRFSMAYVGG